MISLLLHLICVYLTGGFKKPREITWMSGVILAVITVSFSVTGYSLPWDQIGFWACKIVTAIPEALDSLLPKLGTIIVLILRGGSSVLQYSLTRFYSIHTFILPIISLILMLLHFILLRKQGISEPQ